MAYKTRVEVVWDKRDVVRKFMMMAGLSQVQLAGAAGVNKDTITKFFRGTVATDSLTIEKIAKAFNLDVDDLSKAVPRRQDIPGLTFPQPVIRPDARRKGGRTGQRGKLAGVAR